MIPQNKFRPLPAHDIGSKAKKIKKKITRKIIILKHFSEQKHFGRLRPAGAPASAPGLAII
jgi:hypothetical protein